MLDDLFHATVTVDTPHADRAATRARAYRVKHHKNGKAKVTGWFSTEAAAKAWEDEFGEKVDLAVITAASTEDQTPPSLRSSISDA